MSRARRTVTDELLREVAAIYRREIDHAPTEAVAAHLGAPIRTARWWVRRARTAGHLGASLWGKPGETTEMGA
jgi:hypothetical protein